MSKYSHNDFLLVLEYLRKIQEKHTDKKWKLEISTFQDGTDTCIDLQSLIEKREEVPAYLIGATCFAPINNEIQPVVTFVMGESMCEIKYNCFHSGGNERIKAFSSLRDDLYYEHGDRSGTWKSILSEFAVKAECVRKKCLQFPVK